jgi:hypothetical protein
MPVVQEGPARQTWRTNAYARALAAAVMAGLAVATGWGFVALVRAGEWALAFVAPLVFLLPGFALWFWVWSPRTVAGPDGVTVRYGWRTTHVPWAEIARCRAGTGGITITRSDGVEVQAPAADISKLSGLFGRPPKAERVAAYLELRAQYHREGV